MNKEEKNNPATKPVTKTTTSRLIQKIRDSKLKKLRHNDDVKFYAFVFLATIPCTGSTYT